MPLLLAEKDEIQSKKAQQILMKLSIYSPSAVITSIDDLIPLLNKLLNPPVKKNVEGDTPMSMVEIDKVNDLIKSCLRTVVAVNAIEDISVVNRKWLDFFDRIKKDKKLNEMINSLDSDKTLDFYNVQVDNDGWLDEQGRWMNELGRWMIGCIGQLDGGMNRFNGWMDGWMDGWMNEQGVGWID